MKYTDWLLFFSPKKSSRLHNSHESGVTKLSANNPRPSAAVPRIYPPSSTRSLFTSVITSPRCRLSSYCARKKNRQKYIVSKSLKTRLLLDDRRLATEFYNQAISLINNQLVCQSINQSVRLFRIKTHTTQKDTRRQA